MKAVRNPTGATLTGKYAGVEYPIAPGETIELENDVANHIIGQLRKAGVHQVTIETPKIETKHPEVVKQILKKAKTFKKFSDIKNKRI